jgi:hypothetical protein
MFHQLAEELGTPDCLIRPTELDYLESPVASFITGITSRALSGKTMAII